MGKQGRPKGSKITRQQSLFIDRYLTHFCGSRAIREAKYKFSNIHSNAVMAWKLLNENPLIKAEVERRLNIMIEELGVNKFNVAREICRLAFSDPRKLYIKGTRKLKPPSELDDDTAAALALIGSNPRLWDKTKALEILAKHIHFVDQEEKRDSYGININMFPTPEEIEILREIAKMRVAKMIEDGKPKQLAESVE